jgi:uncharacterized protein
MAEIAIQVHPRSSKEAVQIKDGTYHIHINAPPVDGAANTALVALLAKILDIPRRQVSIIHGATSRHKRVAIEGLNSDEIAARIMNQKRTSR